MLPQTQHVARELQLATQGSRRPFAKERWTVSFFHAGRECPLPPSAKASTGRSAFSTQVSFFHRAGRLFPSRRSAFSTQAVNVPSLRKGLNWQVSSETYLAKATTTKIKTRASRSIRGEACAFPSPNRDWQRRDWQRDCQPHQYPGPPRRPHACKGSGPRNPRRRRRTARN